MPKINPNNLLTIANYAKKRDVTTSRIYQLIKKDELTVVKIDNVQFIDVTKIK
jgi:ssDNA-specific exonuclease RecJ